MYELYHHGVKGQKWGVRRYQNADGSLTAAGKKRQASQEASDEKYRTKQLAATENYYNRTQHYGIYGMRTNPGLKSLNKKYDKYEKRGDNEKKAQVKAQIKTKKALKKIEMTKVKNLTHDDIHKEKVAVGKSLAKDILISIGTSAVMTPTIGFTYVQATSPQHVRSTMRMKDVNKK